MSAVLQTQMLLTPEEYLAAEEAAEFKHEYVGGHIYAMAGASMAHNRIVSRLSRLLDQHLDGHPCEVVGSDMKVRPAEDIFYYPDLMVLCDSVDDDTLYVERPRFVFEVSSPSTRRTDETEKAQAYWRVPSIEAYVMVSSEALLVTVLRRGDSAWQGERLTGADDLLRLESIGFEAPLSAVYARTQLA